MNYRVVTYASGKVIREFDTTKRSAVEREYRKATAGAVAVRVWINGEKLPYSVSNKMFTNIRDLANTSFVGRDFGYDGRNGYAM